MISFIIFVNKLGRTRFARYFESVALDKRSSLEARIARASLKRHETKAAIPFFPHDDYNITYRHYSSLFVILASTGGDEVPSVTLRSLGAKSNCFS